MSNFLLTAAAAAVILSAGAATAEVVTLTSEMAAQTWVSAELDMSVYWVAEGDGYAVNAFYTTPDAPAQPARMQMQLVEGDSVTFGLPDVPGRSFNFAAEAGVVSVTSVRTWPLLVSN